MHHSSTRNDNNVAAHVRTLFSFLIAGKTVSLGKAENLADDFGKLNVSGGGGGGGGGGHNDQQDEFGDFASFGVCGVVARSCSHMYLLSPLTTLGGRLFIMGEGLTDCHNFSRHQQTRPRQRLQRPVRAGRVTLVTSRARSLLRQLPRRRTRCRSRLCPASPWAPRWPVSAVSVA